MNKHTPGPWKHHGEAVWSEHKSVSGKETRGTRTTHEGAVSSRQRMPDAEREANSNLIAAAPELLEALEFSITDTGALAEQSPMYALRRLASISEAARSAIAKAKGTQA